MEFRLGNHINAYASGTPVNGKVGFRVPGVVFSYTPQLGLHDPNDFQFGGGPLWLKAFRCLHGPKIEYKRR